MQKQNQKIIPFLWYDHKAEEAAEFYISAFLPYGKNSKVGDIIYHNKDSAAVSGMPEGAAMTVEFELGGQKFTALNGGPEFKFTPAISMFVRCGTEEEIDGLWEKLSEGGGVLMELGKYPFSEKYGWLSDKFGLSWQLNLSSSMQKIAPALLFVGAQHGNAEEAINFYTSVFPDSDIIQIERYGEGEEGALGKIKYSLFSLYGQDFIAMESNLKHDFTFTPAISFLVNCETQEEIDGFWEKLSEGGKKVQCGWLEDKYGVSWQIVPSVLIKYIRDKDAEKSDRVMKAMLQMKKIEIKKLEEAYGK